MPIVTVTPFIDTNLAQKLKLSIPMVKNTVIGGYTPVSGLLSFDLYTFNFVKPQPTPAQADKRRKMLGVKVSKFDLYPIFNIGVPPPAIRPPAGTASVVLKYTFLAKKILDGTYLEWKQVGDTPVIPPPNLSSDFEIPYIIDVEEEVVY